MSELVENETKICEGTSRDPGSNLRCLYQELNKSKDIIKNQKILKDILRVLTYPYIQSGSKQYKLLANDDVKIADTYLLPEPIDKTYKIKVKGEDISLTKKTDKIVVSDSNKEYNLTEDGKYVIIINTYKLITTNQNGITTYKIILNDENNSEITLGKISIDTFVSIRNPNPAPFTCEKNVNPSAWRIPDGQFNSLINQLKTVATDNKFNLDQNNAIKKYILERSQCKHNNGLKSTISSGYKNFIYWRNNGGKKTRKCRNKQRKTRLKQRKTRKTRKSKKTRKPKKGRKGRKGRRTNKR